MFFSGYVKKYTQYIYNQKLYESLFLFACLQSFLIGDFIDNPDDDYDKDGLTENQGDCDDNNEDIQKIVWYVDGDGDGYGLESLQTESCTRPEGYTDQLEDCDDSNAAIHPEADEICDERIDNDCDGKVDDEDDSLQQSSTKYFLKTKMVMDLEMVLHNNCVLPFLVWLTTKMIATMKT